MTSGFDRTFEVLRSAMLTAAPGRQVATDEPGDLVVLTGQTDLKTGRPVWFGAVNVKRSYVAYHLFPLYTTPALGADISAALAKRRQGKSCFNFKAIDPDLLEELVNLTKSADAIA